MHLFLLAQNYYPGRWVGGWVAESNGNMANLSPAEAGTRLNFAIAISAIIDIKTTKANKVIKAILPLKPPKP